MAYKVTQLEPLLLQKVTRATSGKCGASYIDKEFKRWLAKVLGSRHYQVLDPDSVNENSASFTTEGRLMRQVIKIFDEKKQSFSSKSDDDIHVMLPAPLNTLTINGRINEGELTIKHREMKGLFDGCIDEIIELIQGQINQIEFQNARVKVSSVSARSNPF